MTIKPAFGYADAIEISEEKAAAVNAIDSAVERIIERLQACDLTGLWDKKEECITESGLPIADLVNKLVEVRNDLLGYELDPSLTVESLARKDAKTKRSRYLHPADKSALCKDCEDNIGASNRPMKWDLF